MRIAYLNNFFLPRPSGSSHLTAELAKRFARQGDEVVVITLHDGPEVTSRESERRERLDGSLTTLCDCLARTHSTRLRSALAAEAYAVIAAMRNEMDG